MIPPLARFRGVPWSLLSSVLANAPSSTLVVTVLLFEATVNLVSGWWFEAAFSELDDDVMDVVDDDIDDVILDDALVEEEVSDFDIEEVGLEFDEDEELLFCKVVVPLSAVGLGMFMPHCDEGRCDDG